MIEFLYNYLERPLVLLGIPVFILLMLFLVKKNFVNLQGEDATKKIKRQRREWLIFAARLIVIITLFIALSYPYVDSKKTIEGNPRVKILLDNSSSMKIFNTTFVEDLKNKISEEIPVDFGMIATGESSPLGGGLVSNIRKDDNLLLITDGNSNKGITLEDAAIYAKGINATINALNLDALGYDASVQFGGH